MKRFVKISLVVLSVSVGIVALLSCWLAKEIESCFKEFDFGDGFEEDTENVIPEIVN